MNNEGGRSAAATCGASRAPGPMPNPVVAAVLAALKSAAAQGDPVGIGYPEVAGGLRKVPEGPTGERLAEYFIVLHWESSCFGL